jgi:hypothetical protein
MFGTRTAPDCNMSCVSQMKITFFSLFHSIFELHLRFVLTLMSRHQSEFRTAASKLNRKFAREYRLLMELLIFCRLTLSLCIIRLDVTVQRQNKNILDYASFRAAGVRDNFASFTTKTISFATIEANLVNQMCALKYHDMTIIWSN